MVEDISQPLSESYYHLSQDSESDFTTTDEQRGNTLQGSNDTSKLLQLAKVIDKDIEDEIPDPEQVKKFTNTKEKGPQKSPQNKSNIRSKSPSRSRGFAVIDNNVKPTSKDRAGSNNMSSLFSSHSTPLIAKQKFDSNWHKFTKDSILPDIDESQNGEQTINDLVNSLNAGKIDSTNKHKYTFEELLAAWSKLMDSPFGGQIIQYLEDIVENKTINGIDRQQETNNLFKTPLRSRTNSPANNESSDEEDNLSLHTPLVANTERRARRIDQNGSFGPQKDIEQDNNEDIDHDTPRTTPPHSQDEINSKFQSTMIDIQPELNENLGSEKIRNLEEEIKKLKEEAEKMKEENMSLREQISKIENSKIMPEKLDLIDITLDSIDFQDQKVSVDPELQILKNENSALKAKNYNLTKQVDNLQNNYNELSNEIRYERANQKSTGQDNRQMCHPKPQVEEQETSTPTNQKLKFAEEEIEKLKSDLSRLASEEIGEKNNLITENTVEARFRQYYSRLELHKVDNMTKVEMSNLIKNLMLSLLISDFSNLAVNARKFGRFLKLALHFLDRLHSVIYVQGDPNIKPSFYVKNSQDIQAMENLGQCLHGMLENVEVLRTTSNGW
ncbi:hypothetical protein G9P44_003092 [Scheffersomyces stipitis]|nr:hypothetical protein G9P44_003092 [Scheffersomyces stipitis]